MTREYGALLAQVIPVLLLALVLEARALIRIGAEEASFIQSLPAEDRQYHRNRMKPRDTAISLGVYFVISLGLARSEVIALLAAAGVDVPDWEGYVAFSFATISLLYLVIFAVALEVYRGFGGTRWPRWLFVTYSFIVSLVVIAFFTSVNHVLG